MRMTSHIAKVLLLGVLLASPSVTASFDFYYLVLLWPGSYCGQSKCCRPTNGLPQKDFLLRGLWTYNSATGEPVTRCERIPFDYNQISSLSGELVSYWSNIRCPSNDGKSNWKNAWKTYGVCTGQSLREYFKTALDLRSEVDLLSHLTRKGIVQDKYKQYSVLEIEKAIAEGIGATPLIQCSKGRSGAFQLYQVYICVDEAAEKVIECPVKPEFYCPPTVLFPPFDYSNFVGPRGEKTKMPLSIE
ncbi:ribonuclease 1-like [Asparagus officinalis]|uniref:ribonuclease 1-like n=1 Tax=Asparagus officinalis TaxID=4686 RepID=UPI00098E6DCE|nr:ribonuclease 1-like [Asparagus officinalis]